MIIVPFSSQHLKEHHVKKSASGHALKSHANHIFLIIHIAQDYSNANSCNHKHR